MTRREFASFLLFLLCVFSGVIMVHVLDEIDEVIATQESYDATR